MAKTIGYFFFNFDSTKILNRSVGDILNFVFDIFFYLGLILLFFNHIEQTTPDDPCEKYGLQFVFIHFNLKLLTQFSGSK